MVDWRNERSPSYSFFPVSAKRRAVAPAHVPPVVPIENTLDPKHTLALTSTARACKAARLLAIVVSVQLVEGRTGLVALS